MIQSEFIFRLGFWIFRFLYFGAFLCSQEVWKISFFSPNRKAKVLGQKTGVFDSSFIDSSMQGTFAKEGLPLVRNIALLVGNQTAQTGVHTELAVQMNKGKQQWSDLSNVTQLVSGRGENMT